MSNSHIFLKAGFPKVTLQNGIGRFIGQLQRVTIKFCKNNGSSRGVRDFIESDLLNFANSHPGIVVYVKPRRHHAPSLTAEYLNGERQVINCRNYTRAELAKWLNLLRTQSGEPTVRLMKHWHTDCPSIQGPWTPFTHRDPHLNLATFPQRELSQPVHMPPTATEQLVEMFKQQQQANTALDGDQVK